MPVYPETDRTMLKKTIANQKDGWETFYQQYSPVVRALCRIHRVAEDQIEDVLQETMKRFARNCGSYEYDPARARFRTYFNRIVRGAIADHFRARAKQSFSDAGDALPEDGVPPEWEAAELEAWRTAVLDAALRRLASRVSEKNYLAFTMSVLHGHPIRETAEFLGVSTARVYQARRRCALLLKEIVRRCNEADPQLHLEAPEL